MSSLRVQTCEADGVSQASLYVKPRLRGVLHAGTAVVAVPAGGALVAVVDPSPPARLGAAIYALGLVGLFSVSGLYHRLAGTRWGRPWQRWADHAMIYVLIAATYTPICIAGLSTRWAVPLLVVVWTVAVVGVVMKLTPARRYRRALNALYLVMGWGAVVALPAFVRNLSPTVVALMIAGGLLYTAGATVLFRKSPQLRPMVFGYHELWHVFVVAAGVCHFAMVLLALRGYRAGA